MGHGFCHPGVVGGLLDAIYLAALAVALWGTGIALGVSLGARELAAPARRPGLIARVALVDVVILPPLVWVLVHALSIPAGYADGLLLVAIASGGPLAIKAAQLARADVAAAVSLVLLLELLNLAAFPVWAPRLLTGGADVRVADVLVTVVGFIMLPLVVGGVWRRRSPDRAPRLVPYATRASNLGLALVIAIVLARDGDTVAAAAADWVPLAAALAVVAALALGWLAGGSGRATRAAVSLVTGVRANGLALAVAAASFPGRADVRAGVVVFALFSMLLPVLLAVALGRRAAAPRLAPS